MKTNNMEEWRCVIDQRVYEGDIGILFYRELAGNILEYLNDNKEIVREKYDSPLARERKYSFVITRELFIALTVEIYKTCDDPQESISMGEVKLMKEYLSTLRNIIFLMGKGRGG